jgi:hypothetical protein
VSPCGAGQAPGAACSAEGATCDPGDECNRLLQCATSDPTHGGACPISRRGYKQDIRYLGAQDLQRLHDQLMKFPLATYRYQQGDARSHLGFVIEDVEPSMSVEPGRDVVDLYGYASMAVAALQFQARQIETLQRRIEHLERQLEKRRRVRPASE